MTRQSPAERHREALARLMKMAPPLAIYAGDPIETRREYFKSYVGWIKAWHAELVALADLVNEDARDNGLVVEPLGNVASMEAVFADEIVGPWSAAVDGEE